MTEIWEGCIREYMHEHLEVLQDSDSALDAAIRMRDRRVGSVFVETLDRRRQDCRLAGIVTETDLVTRVLAQGRDPGKTSVGQIMSSPLVTIGPDRPMIDASHLMDAHHIRHLGVSDGPDVIGIISMRDLAKHFTDATSGAAQDLNDVHSPLTVLMRRPIETLETRDTVTAAARWMTQKQIGSAFIVEADEIVGIVTESDIIRKALAGGKDPGLLALGELLTFPLISIEQNRSIQEVCQVMASHHVRHLAITDRQKVVGVVSIRDIVKLVAARDRPAYLRRT